MLRSCQTYGDVVGNLFIGIQWLSSASFRIFTYLENEFGSDCFSWIVADVCAERTSAIVGDWFFLSIALILTLGGPNLLPLFSAFVT
jgi:hypothetical protein